MKRLLNFSAKVPKSQAHCQALVKQYDRENDIGISFLNDEHRRAAYAIRAFNLTVANCTNSVTDDCVARLKLQFWLRQSRCKADEQEIGNPVCEELAWLKSEAKVPGILLRKLVDSRIERLEYGRHFQPFNTIDDLESYADKTHGTMFQCNLTAMGVKDIMIDQASRNLARAIGFTQVLRATQFYSAMGHVGIPLDLCRGHKVKLSSLITSHRNPEPKTTKEIEEVVFDLSSRAVGYITKTRTQYQVLDPDVRRLFIASTTGSDLWLKKLERVQFDIFSQKLMEQQTAELSVAMAHKHYIKKKF